MTTRILNGLFLVILLSGNSFAAPGDKTSAAATAFTNITGAGGKAVANKAKDTLKIQGGGATTVSISPGSKTVTVSTPAQVQTDWTASSGLAKILNQPAETCTGRLSWDGIDGTQIYYGTGTPAAETGIEKDFYINSANWDFYRKEGSPAAWALKGNMVGPANTLTVGTITTLAYTEPAACTISGAAPNQELSCGIPQGIPGPPAALTRGSITTELAEPDNTIVYLTPGTDSAVVGGLVVNDYGTNAAIIIQNGRVEVLDSSGVTIAKIDRAAGTVATYDTSGNLSAKLDRDGGIYGYKAGNAVGMSWTRAAGALVLY